MLDRLFESPMFSVAAILFVAYMAGVYFLNRERAAVSRLRGRKRFSPDWAKSRHGARRRRRRIGTASRGEFKPDWTHRPSKPSPDPSARTTKPHTEEGDG